VTSSVTAIYAGSFDVLTYGHIDVIEQTLKLFGNCKVLIANNGKKNTIFTPSERYNHLSLWRSIKGYSTNVEIIVWNRLVIDYFSDDEDNRVLIRGIRDPNDMFAEMKLADVNEELSGVKTIFIPTKNELRNYSSTLVKELYSFGKDVSKYCPVHVVEALKEK
jgi:pantetheine-phosphate adenylyltransferase